jgi:hypothetical protein
LTIGNCRLKSRHSPIVIRHSLKPVTRKASSLSRFWFLLNPQSEFCNPLNPQPAHPTIDL